MKTYLEQRKELEDRIKLFQIKIRRSPSRGHAIHEELVKQLAELDAIEIMKCKNDPYYFASNYLYVTSNGKPYIPALNKERFNKKFKELQNSDYANYILNTRRKWKVNRR